MQTDLLPSPTCLLVSRAARQLFATISLLLVVLGAGSSAWAQCSCTAANTISNANNNTASTFNPADNTSICISAGTTFTGTIDINANNVTICNEGTISSTAVFVSKSARGTIINNGSASGSAAVWSEEVGPRFAGQVTINNYGSWTGEIQPLASGSSINNKSGASWTKYMTYAGNLAVVNNGTWTNVNLQPSNSATATLLITNTGTWSSYLAPIGTITINNSGTWNASGINYTGNLTINHTAGTWSTGLNPNGNSAVDITNRATWNAGFSFPSPGPNRFVNAAGAIANCADYFGVSGATTLINNGTMNLNGGMAALPNTSSLTNGANSTFDVQGQLLSSGTISNAGTITVRDNFANSGFSFTNSQGSFLTIGGQFDNSGTMANSGTIALTGTLNFSNSGVISGPDAPFRGSITARGYTVNSGTFGVVGNLDFCDTSTPPPANGFDAPGGTIGSNTTFCSSRPLPVELTTFTAELARGQVQVRWSTASEHNSAKFLVERSADGELFAAVHQVAAQGNTTRPTAYAATDTKPLAGTSYYRLRQVDLDGSTAFSPVAAIRSEAASLQVFDFYPNPATNHLAVDLRTALAAPCEVRIISATGQAVLAQTLAGGRVQDLSLAGLPAGLYLLQVRTKQGSTVQRIQKQ